MLKCITCFRIHIGSRRKIRLRKELTFDVSFESAPKIACSSQQRWLCQLTPVFADCALHLALVCKRFRFGPLGIGKGFCELLLHDYCFPRLLFGLGCLDVVNNILQSNVLFS